MHRSYGTLIDFFFAFFNGLKPVATILFVPTGLLRYLFRKSPYLYFLKPHFCMKKLTLTLFLALICSVGFAQNVSLLQTDSLKNELLLAKHDTSRVLIMATLTEAYRWSKPDSAMLYGQQALNLAKQIKFLRGEANTLISISVVQRELGNLPKALEMALKGLQIAQENHFDREEVLGYVRIANVYLAFKNYNKAINYLYQSEKKLKYFIDGFYLSVTQTIKADTYMQMNKLDSAQIYAGLATQHFLQYKTIIGLGYRVLGDIQVKLKNETLALSYYHQGVRAVSKLNDYRSGADLNIKIASFYKKKNQLDSAIYYAKEGLSTAQKLSYKNRIMAASSILAELYESKEPREAIRYYKIFSAARDSLYSNEKMQALQTMTFDEQERQFEIETAKTAYQNKVGQYLFIIGLGIFLIISLILFRNNRQKQKANKVLENTLSKLKATQNQLIQSEKLASLGELTAGIAHEIQNPLNFVNNFSELSKELIQELLEEENKPLNTQDPILKTELLNDLSSNQEKINLHGKRASSIVTGMLQHSQASSGKKELIDINKLVDESLRLSFNSFNAKNKNGSTLRFDCKIETIFDENLPKIKVIPQDIGRVLINLCNNAFYAVSAGNLQGLEKDLTGYEPTISVVTSSLSCGEGRGEVRVEIKDNGIGIPDNIKSKIFQPFFTTKPTGQGTGLGLSLAYDIITKGHGGTLEVESVEGEGTTFIVKMPIQNI
jgi:two-component system, NtrC family, sensor kinase